MTPELKARIDAMTHEQLAEAWRFAPAGDPLFQGEAGAYCAARLRALGGIPPALSKRIGWTPR